MNYGIITLLPKVADAEKIQQYKHICLLNCLYKWITKVLTLRLEPLMDKLILINQTAFMKWRDIINGVMALHEVLHDTKTENITWVVLKLHFEKLMIKSTGSFSSRAWKCEDPLTHGARGLKEYCPMGHLI